MAYLRNVLIAVDQLFNTLCNGWPDETLSSRAWRWKAAKMCSWPCNFIDVLFFFDRENGMRHCQLSYESERRRMQLPPEFRLDGLT